MNKNSEIIFLSYNHMLFFIILLVIPITLKGYVIANNLTVYTNIKLLPVAPGKNIKSQISYVGTNLASNNLARHSLHHHVSYTYKANIFCYDDWGKFYQPEKTAAIITNIFTGELKHMKNFLLESTCPILSPIEKTIRSEFMLI